MLYQTRKYLKYNQYKIYWFESITVDLKVLFVWISHANCHFQFPSRLPRSGASPELFSHSISGLLPFDEKKWIPTHFDVIVYFFFLCHLCKRSIDYDQCFPFYSANADLPELAVQIGISSFGKDHKEVIFDRKMPSGNAEVSFLFGLWRSLAMYDALNAFLLW